MKAEALSRDQSGWSRVSKGERGRTEGQGGDGEGLAGSCGLQEDLGFYPESRWLVKGFIRGSVSPLG